jgi:putative nucleotidyltransferase with HDIG domain
MNRHEALDFVTQRIENDNLIRHMLATEAVMTALAHRLGQNPDRWGLAGLVHDCDLAETESTPESHGKVGADWLREAGVDEEICRAVHTHPGWPGAEPKEPIEVALRAADQVTGLITAAALVHPTRSIAALKVKSLKKRMKEKRFAAGVDREAIKTCESLELPLEEFLALATEAMKTIAHRLGLPPTAEPEHVAAN